jgi:hypothetical protein
MKSLIKNVKIKFNTTIELLAEAEEEHLREKARKEHQRQRTCYRTNHSHPEACRSDSFPGTCERHKFIKKDRHLCKNCEQARIGMSQSETSSSSSGDSQSTILARLGRIAILSPKGIKNLKNNDSRHYRWSSSDYREKDQDRYINPRSGQDYEQDHHSPLQGIMASSEHHCHLPKRSSSLRIKLKGKDNKILGRLSDTPYMQVRCTHPKQEAEILSPQRVPKEAGSKPRCCSHGEEKKAEREKRGKVENENRRADLERKRLREAVCAEASMKLEYEKRADTDCRRRRRDTIEMGNSLNRGMGRNPVIESSPVSARNDPRFEPRNLLERSKSVNGVANSPTRHQGLKPPQTPPASQVQAPLHPMNPAHVARHITNYNQNNKCGMACGDMTRTYVYGMVSKEEKTANDRTRHELRTKGEGKQLARRGKGEEEEEEGDNSLSRLSSQTMALNRGAQIGDNTRTYIVGLVSKEEKDNIDRARKAMR